MISTQIKEKRQKSIFTNIKINTEIKLELPGMKFKMEGEDF